jgi:hypothetical protein
MGFKAGQRRCADASSHAGANACPRRPAPRRPGRAHARPVGRVPGRKVMRRWLACRGARAPRPAACAPARAPLVLSSPPLLASSGLPLTFLAPGPPFVWALPRRTPCPPLYTHAAGRRRAGMCQWRAAFVHVHDMLSSLQPGSSPPPAPPRRTFAPNAAPPAAPAPLSQRARAPPPPRLGPPCGPARHGATSQLAPRRSAPPWQACNG